MRYKNNKIKNITIIHKFRNKIYFAFFIIIYLRSLRNCIQLYNVSLINKIDVDYAIDFI